MHMYVSQPESFFLRDFFPFLALFPSITELLRPLEYALFGTYMWFMSENS